MLSTFLLIIFFVFIAGYFWGHQTAVEEFSANIEQQSFADQIHYSLSCCVDDNQTLYSYDDSAEQELELEEQAPAVCPQQQITVQKPESSERYCAHLVGFQSKEKAYQCMQTIVNKGLSVKVAQRSSKTKNGKLYTWYQVVTSPYSTKSDLLDHIATIQQIVKLHDIQIVSIPNKKEKKV